MALHDRRQISDMLHVQDSRHPLSHPQPWQVVQIHCSRYSTISSGIENRVESRRKLLRVKRPRHRTAVHARHCTATYYSVTYPELDLAEHVIVCELTRFLDEGHQE